MWKRWFFKWNIMLVLSMQNVCRSLCDVYNATVMGLFWVGSLCMRAGFEVTRAMIFMVKMWGHMWTKLHLVPQTCNCLPQREAWMQAFETAYRHAADNFGVQQPPVLILAISTGGAVRNRERPIKHLFLCNLIVVFWDIKVVPVILVNFPKNWLKNKSVASFTF